MLKPFGMFIFNFKIIMLIFTMTRLRNEISEAHILDARLVYFLIPMGILVKRLWKIGKVRNETGITSLKRRQSFLNSANYLPERAM